ncbi:hypothetical protein M409DRAFT_17162 [Zasmidium cellare ATCC 36951]|uniref:PNPLA domain-containing protein n=1 Tax=Zasmidium cellare ATCC 36951 TaxID=1080233 RepID=A0A6A6D6C1_ZASCE|nr:uncharacterized protein M409DRAFT_17162 [Zasmidium cellare ATCC 36951]KAF2173216.1 hypothetical protein M409DRAFT_17162 [Zasmidium cellare ATCC 36951]
MRDPDPKQSLFSLPRLYHGALNFSIVSAEIGFVWVRKFSSLLTTKAREDLLLDDLLAANDYEEWYAAAHALDELPPKYDWRINPKSDYYDYRTLDKRRRQLNTLRRNGSPQVVADYLRHGLQRNFCNITRSPLYTKTYASTKNTIEAYIEESVETVKWICDFKTSPHPGPGKLTDQEKMEIVSNARSAYGSTALLLQGGSVFGLCHLGVVKALLEHGILPNVVMGTATGALMAALVCIHTNDELPAFLSGDSIDLSAFTASSQRARDISEEYIEYTAISPPRSRLHNWSQILSRRVWRLFTKGFVLDPEVLVDCVRANVGDLTFQEAFDRTGRVLNIIVASPNEEIPSLMNYLTAPNFLIRTAALASNIANMSHSPNIQIEILRKDRHGRVEPVPGTGGTNAHAVAESNPPLPRLKQLFDVDHCIISQARPYMAPIVKPSLPYIRPQDSFVRNALRRPINLVPFDFEKHLKHYMTQADSMGWLSDNLHRILSDETTKGDSVTLVPEIEPRDLLLLLKNPGKKEVEFWIKRGERSVWPSLCALKVRCLIEVALDATYERLRRRRVGDQSAPPSITLLPPGGGPLAMKFGAQKFVDGI